MNKIELWRQMADLTFTKCQEHCSELGSCCSSEYCEEALRSMQRAGEPLTKGCVIQNGRCIIPPHFRPLCSLHQCKIASLGCDPKDPEWTKKYFELREKLELSEMEI